MRTPIITTVDIVLFTLIDGALHVGLLKRNAEPYLDRLALPGGYIHPEEDADGLSAAKRVLKAKVGLTAPYLEQLYTFAEAARDPRGWSVSLVYYALVGENQLKDNTSPDFELVSVADLPLLPFDHSRIVAMGLERLQNKSAYSALPCYLLGEAFTLSELQETYEYVLGQPLDKSVFRRKIDEQGFLEPIPDSVRRGKHRPAQLYRIKPSKNLALFEKTL